MVGKSHTHLSIQLQKGMEVKGKIWPPCYLLIVLPDEGLWAHHQLGDIGVLVQHMNVVVGRNTVDALPSFFFLCSVHCYSILQEKKWGWNSKCLRKVNVHHSVLLHVSSDCVGYFMHY